MQGVPQLLPLRVALLVGYYKTNTLPQDTSYANSNNDLELLHGLSYRLLILYDPCMSGMSRRCDDSCRTSFLLSRAISTGAPQVCRLFLTITRVTYLVEGYRQMQGSSPDNYLCLCCVHLLILRHVPHRITLPETL